MFWKLGQLAFDAIVVILVLIGALLDAFGYAEAIQKHIPWLGRAMKNRIVLCMLMLFSIGFLTKDFRDVVAIGPPPQPIIIKTPPPPPIEIQIVSRTPITPTEASDSLRRRTFKLADEFTAYWVSIQTDKNRPPDAFPDSADPNPSEERKKAIKATQTYYKGVEDYYFQHFKDQFVAIVKEYDSRGVKTGWLVNDFAQRMPAIPPPESVMAGMDEISQFRDLAYHVDARDHLITF